MVTLLQKVELIMQAVARQAAGLTEHQEAKVRLAVFKGLQRITREERKEGMSNGS